VTAVSSGGQVTALADGGVGGETLLAGGSSWSGIMADYGAIWRTQPEVRKVTGFLARNIAQLNLTLYRRLSATERERVDDHELSRAISHPLGWRPSAKLSKSLFFDTLMHDRCIYDNAYWLKIRENGELRLVPVPPPLITPEGYDWLAPTGYRFANRDWPAEQFVHFRGYNAGDRRTGLSPIESLRQLLLEDMASNVYRSQLWERGARMSGVIQRPADAPKWSDPARERFQASWRAQWSGNGPEAGGTPVLEDGMEFKETTFSAADAQWLEAKKLTREEVAAAYHVPQPMVGLLDRATFSNVAELHDQLYQDTLPPWCVSIEEDVELQLISDWPELMADNCYVEFNLMEKLKGSFEKRARIMQTATGGPWLTRNEARAMDNRPRIDDPACDQLIVPLNVIVGGQASPTDSAASGEASRVVGRWLSRCGTAVVGRWHTARAGHLGLNQVWQAERWTRELTRDLEGIDVEDPDEVAGRVVARAGRAVTLALADPDPDQALDEFFSADPADTLSMMIEEEV